MLIIPKHVCSLNVNICKLELSQCMRFLTMWYVRPAKPQISLRIRAVWSESLLVAWIFYECWATYRTSFGDSKLKGRLHRLVWVYTCQNVTLLEITCRGLIMLFLKRLIPNNKKSEVVSSKVGLWSMILEFPGHAHFYSHAPKVITQF